MIFCVEDDNSIRDLWIYTLKFSGFEAKGFPEGDSFIAALRDTMPELVILDVMLPRRDGIEILKFLRESEEYSSIPVIMATAKGAEFDKVRALDLGADDYVTKPFGVMEMVSRVKAVLRRCSSHPAESKKILTSGGITLNVSEHTCLVDGKEITLTFKEYKLLKLLMSNEKEVFTRDALLSEVWGFDYIGETRTVDVHIGTLRTKLGAYADYIETVRGVGYKFEPVEAKI